MACIYCRRSHMTCDENRPCQRWYVDDSRSIKRDIGHLCRDEVTQPSASGSVRNRQSRKPTEQPIAQSPLFQKAPLTGGPQEIHPHDLNVPPPSNTGIPRLEHDMSSSQTFSPDALSASRLSATYPPATGAPFSMAPQFTTAQDVSLVPHDKTRSVDPNLSFFRPMQPIQPTMNGAPSSIDQLSMTQPRAMFGAPPMDTRSSSLRNEKLPEMQSSQLGGTAWLGLGGGTGRPSIVGDSGGGGELNILSEYLESLDDGAPWFHAPEKGVGPAADAIGLPFKPDAAPTINPGLQRTSSTTNLLGTPPSMVDQDPIGLDAEGTSLTDPHGSLSLLSPPKTMALRNAPNSPYRYGRKRPSSEMEHDASLSMADYTQPVRAAADEHEKPDAKPGSSSTEPYPPLLANDASKTERFLLTAADQTDGSRDERLRKVIQAKYEAGLLRPYNHVNGYARLNRWMEQNVSASSRRRILKPLSVFRPVFYSIAKKLTNYDLIYIEEAFERLLLDYDRVFSIQSIPACLWRRTGEIYKGNKEFADLVGVSIESLREGRLCIYELMAEESAVNYWEKYGSVSFDPSQKAVLTMCKLRTKNTTLANATAAVQEPTSSEEKQDPKPDAGSDADASSAPTDATPARAAEHKNPVPCITCCFSFTIRRDKWNVCLIGSDTDPYNDCRRTCKPNFFFVEDSLLTDRISCRLIRRRPPWAAKVWMQVYPA